MRISLFLIFIWNVTVIVLLRSLFFLVLSPEREMCRNEIWCCRRKIESLAFGHLMLVTKRLNQQTLKTTENDLSFNPRETNEPTPNVWLEMMQSYIIWSVECLKMNLFSAELVSQRINEKESHARVHSRETTWLSMVPEKCKSEANHLCGRHGFPIKFIWSIELMLLASPSLDDAHFVPFILLNASKRFEIDDKWTQVNRTSKAKCDLWKSNDEIIVLRRLNGRLVVSLSIHIYVSTSIIIFFVRTSIVNKSTTTSDDQTDDTNGAPLHANGRE